MAMPSDIDRSMVILFVLLLGLGGCGAMPKAAGPEILAVDAYEMSRRGRVLVVDIRPEEERVHDGAPRDARAIPYPTGFFSNTDAFVSAVDDAVHGKRASPIALMCRRGVTSRAAQGLLLAEGFRNVYSVSDGFMGSEAGPGWKGWGLPIERP